LKIVRRLPKCKVSPSPFDEDTIVILGGGASGNAAAEKLREVYIKINYSSIIVLN